MEMDILQYFGQFPILPHILAFIIGIPSAFLYSIEVILIVKYRMEFNSSFFKLLLIRAIGSIYNFLLSYLAPRFLLLGLFFEFYNFLPPFFLKFFLFSTYYTFHLENMSTLAMVLNRLTAIIFPMSHENIWKKLLPISAALIFIIPFAINYQIFEIGVHLYYHDESNKSFGFIGLDSGAFPNADLNFFSTITFAIVCCCLNVTAWIALRQHTAKFKQQGIMANNNSVAMEHNRMELRLFIFSFCTFLCQFIMALFYYGVHLATLHGLKYSLAKKWSNALWFNYGLINDICTVAVPAWLMLWSCSALRILLVKSFCNLKNTLMRRLNGTTGGGSNHIKVHPIHISYHNS